MNTHSDKILFLFIVSPEQHHQSCRHQAKMANNCPHRNVKAVFHFKLRRALYNLALSISAHPGLYVLVPLAVTAVSSLGMLNATLSHDVEWLFTGKGTRMDESYKMFKSYFEPEGRSGSADFIPGRSLDMKSFLRVLVLTKNRNERVNNVNSSGTTNVIDDGPYEEVLEIDAFLRGLPIDNCEETKGLVKNCRYEGLCAKVKGEGCLLNPAIQV